MMAETGRYTEFIQRLATNTELPGQHTIPRNLLPSQLPNRKVPLRRRGRPLQSRQDGHASTEGIKLPRNGIDHE